MKTEKIYNKSVFLFFVWTIILMTFTSTWVCQALPVLFDVRRIMTVLTYLPFAASILWKLVCDIKDLKTKKLDALSIIYYSFAVYYAVLFIYRLFSGAEVKDTFYYSLVLFGSISMFSQIHLRRLPMSEETLKNNLFWFSYVLVGYFFLYEFAVKYFIDYIPLNPILLTGALVVLSPVTVEKIKKAQTEKTSAISAYILLAATVVVVLLSGSRALFALSIFVMAALIIINVKNGFVRRHLIWPLVTGILFTLILFIADYGAVRYNIIRESGISMNSSFAQSLLKDEHGETDENTNNFNDPFQQIERSDSMRSELMKAGIAEFQKFPLFGTGNVFFPYQIGIYNLEQEAHNFIIETLAGYGIIGLLFCAGLIFTILYSCGILSLKRKEALKEKLSVLCVLAFFFALASVQAILYSVFTLPVLLCVLAFFDKVIHRIEENPTPNLTE